MSYTPKVGDRVRIIHNLDYINGLTGTITGVGAEFTYVRLDTGYINRYGTRVLEGNWYHRRFQPLDPPNSLHGAWST